MGMGRSEGRPVDHFIPTQRFAPLNPLESGVDELTRMTLLKLLLLEAEKSCASRRQLVRIDCHMAALRQLIYRQVELAEKGHDADHIKSGSVLVPESPAPILDPHPPNPLRGWGRHF